jgi:UDP-N-acetylglucosamine 4,6-dehydratase/UDP-glucose 4-epimerase
MDQAIDFILASMRHAKGSEIFVPKMKSYTLKDLSAAFLGANLQRIQVEVKGVRVGEKDHELLINEHELKYTRELPFGYVICTPDKGQPNRKPTALSGLSSYSSETADRLTKDELIALLRRENPTLNSSGKRSSEETST